MLFRSGYSAGEMVGLPRQAFRPEAHAESQVHDISAFDSPSGACYETVQRRKDGSQFPAEISGRAVREEGGQVHIAFIRDITQRKQTEHALLRLNQLYAASSAISAANAHAVDPDALAGRICQILVEAGGLSMVWVGWLDALGRSIIPSAVHGDRTGYAQKLEITVDGAHMQPGPSAVAFREGRIYVCNDFFNDPSTEHWRAAAQAAG